MPSAAFSLKVTYLIPNQSAIYSCLVDAAAAL